MQGLVIRPLEPRDSFAELTTVVRSAYQQLADMGFRYWGTYQSEEDTQHRCESGHCLVAELDGRLVGTITCKSQDTGDSVPEWYQRPEVWFVTQFAVIPELKGQGIGHELMNAAEAYIRSQGASEAALDTAEGAKHLIRMYHQRGYRLVGKIDWQGTNYISVVMSKRLRVSIPTNRLVLRDIRPEDRGVFGAWWNHPEYHRSYPPNSMTPTKAEELVDHFIEEQSATPRRNYSLGVELDGQLIGIACIRFEFKRGSANIGYEINPEFWRHGYATEAVTQLLRIGFDEVKIPRIEAWVYGANEPSQKFLERIGFTCEGRLRQKVPWGEGRMDDLIYSMLLDEYAQLPISGCGTIQAVP